MRYLLSILLLLGCGSCAEREPADTHTMYVSILPLRGLVCGIVGEDFTVETLVPPGASPETFEPTPRQFIGLNRAQLIFSTGLIDFETTLLARIEQPAKIVDLSRGIPLIEGKAVKGVARGADPHVWCAPKELQIMARNAYEAIHRLYPDSTKYTANYARLQRQLAALDARTGQKIVTSGIKSLLIYHPALSYYARDYGLQQIAVEQEGKEPSAKRLAQIIDAARTDSVRYIFYERQFPRSTVEVIAADIGAQCVALDPLREDPIKNIDGITDKITQK